MKPGMLARATALLFARSGLLPPEASFLATDPAARLVPVLKIAFRHLRESRAAFDKWALFVLVIGYIVVAWATIVTMGLLLIASAAHAQTPSATTQQFFTPPSSQDLAQQWINYLFFAQDISGYVSQSGQIIPQATSIQKALQSALGFYSDAILVIAAFILFYHLIAMVAETAHHGVPMGKRANQIWAPIRLVVAIGLLVPVSSGLNSGQYIILKVAEMGSGLASQTWQTFLTALAGQGVTYHAPKAPYVRKVVEDLVEMQACQLAYNYQVASALGIMSTDYSQSLINAVPQPALVDPVSGIAVSTGNATLYTNALLSDQGICGSYEIGDAPVTSGGDPNLFETQASKQIAQAHLNTINALLNGGQVTAVAKNIKYFITGFPHAGGSGTPTPGFTAGDFLTDDNLPSQAPIEALVTAYQTALQQNLSGALASLNDTSIQNIAANWASQGWVSAGAWFNTIARSQGAILEATEDGIPKTSPPKVNQVTGEHDALTRASQWLMGNRQLTRENDDVAMTVAKSLDAFDAKWLRTPAAATASASSASQDAQAVQQQRLKDAAAGEDTSSGWNLMDRMLAVLDGIMVSTGMWSGGDLTFQFGSTANPLAEVAYFGHSMLSGGFNLMGAAGIASVANAAFNWLGPIGAMVGKGFGIAGGFMAFIAVILIAGGFTMAFLTPLIPFIRFFFNILSWMMAVFEGVVFTPLIALAHLNPEGDGLPGPSARQAYFLVLNIFLRPVLMVFGLICGLLMFFVAISFLNMMFTLAAIGTGASAGGFHTIAKLVFSIIYVALTYICANNCFKAIGYFPEHALRWIGGQAHHERMGSPTEMANVMTGVSALAGNQLAQGLRAVRSIGPGPRPLRPPGHPELPRQEGPPPLPNDTGTQPAQYPGFIGFGHEDPGGPLPGSSPQLPGPGGPRGNGPSLSGGGASGDGSPSPPSGNQGSTNAKLERDKRGDEAANRRARWPDSRSKT